MNQMSVCACTYYQLKLILDEPQNVDKFQSLKLSISQTLHRANIHIYQAKLTYDTSEFKLCIHGYLVTRITSDSKHHQQHTYLYNIHLERNLIRLLQTKFSYIIVCLLVSQSSQVSLPKRSILVQAIKVLYTFYSIEHIDSAIQKLDHNHKHNHIAEAEADIASKHTSTFTHNNLCNQTK